MPAAFDAASEAGYDTTARTTLSWTHTPAGTPTLAVVMTQFGGNPGSYSAATYGGQAMTEVTGSPHNNGSAWLNVFVLASPPSGAQTIELTWTNSQRGGAGACTFTSTTGVGALVTATDSNATTISFNVSSSTNGMVMDAANVLGDATITVGADQTERWNTAYGSSNGNTGAGSTEPGAATVTMSWTGLDGTNTCAMVGLPITGVSAAVTRAALFF